jgi:predicted small secreted protein
MRRAAAIVLVLLVALVVMAGSAMAGFGPVDATSAKSAMIVR